MLCRFTFANFRSFYEETTLDLQASLQRTPFQPERVKGFGKLRLLPAAVIYGPNAGGKSNVVLAAQTFQAIVLRGLEGVHPPLELLPFVHQADESKPMLFEMDFITKGRRYIYRVEIALSGAFTKQCEAVIAKEQLDFYDRKLLLHNLFIRTCEKIDISREGAALALMEAKDDEKLSHDEQSANKNMDIKKLFLTGGFQAAISKAIAAEVIGFFTHGLAALVDIKSIDTRMLFRDVRSKMRIAESEEGEYSLDVPLFNCIQAFSDIGPQHILVDVDDSEEGENAVSLYAEYKVGNSNRKIMVPATWTESLGTLAMLQASPILLATLQQGSTLILDELDDSIHPEMIASLIAAFNDPALNPNHAQLIFTSHNYAYLNKKLLRRDQILFAQKKEDFSSELYSLADFGSEEVRGDGSLLRQYFKGNFGALPLGSFAMALRKLQQEGDECDDE